MAAHVNVDNFVRAETDRMFAALGQQAGGVNTLHHHREPASIDEQPVIRQNRDTLYTMASWTSRRALSSRSPMPGTGTCR